LLCFLFHLFEFPVEIKFLLMFLTSLNVTKKNDKNNEKIVLRHKMQMQNQQRSPFSNRETRNESNVSSTYS